MRVLGADVGLRLPRDLVLLRWGMVPLHVMLLWLLVPVTMPVVRLLPCVFLRQGRWVVVIPLKIK